MMDVPVILAHGELGAWDEVVFLGVAALFLLLMGISWFRSRRSPVDVSENHETSTMEPAESNDRFRLE